MTPVRKIHPTLKGDTMVEEGYQATIWKIVGGIAVSAVLAGVGFTWSTYVRTTEMQSSLNMMCVAVPELKMKIEKMDIEIQTARMTDIEVKGRLFFLERSLEAFEKRITNNNLTRR